MHPIGKLAKTCGISVRTLRYYDEIDLLKPLKVEGGGHRYYNNESIIRLQTIVALKDLGFGLEKIREIIDKSSSLKDSLQMRLNIIKLEQERLKKKEVVARYVLQVMELEDVADWVTIYDTIYDQKPKKNEIENLWSSNFSPEEKQKLNNLPKVGKDYKQIEEWIVLIKDIRENIHKEPTSSEAEQLAQRWINLTDDMFNENRKLAQKTWEFSKKHGQSSGFYQYDKKVIAYIEKAIDHFCSNHGKDDSDEETYHSP